MIFYDLIENAYGPMLEDWRDVKGYEGFYQVSNYGRAKSLKRKVLVSPQNGKRSYYQYYEEKIMNVTINKNKNQGYASIMLHKDKTQKRIKIHRMQAKVFLSNFDEKLDVNHKNGIRDDNFILNHEMVTSSQNKIHMFRVLKTYSLKGRSNASLNKPVDKIDPITNEIIKSFDSMNDAAKDRGIHPTNISAFVRGIRKDSKGYIWKYKKIKTNK